MHEVLPSFWSSKDMHTVEITEFYCHNFFAKIPSNQRFTKELYYKLIWRKKICVAWQWISRFSTLWTVNFCNFHTVYYTLYANLGCMYCMHTIVFLLIIFNFLSLKTKVSQRGCWGCGGRQNRWRREAKARRAKTSNSRCSQSPIVPGIQSLCWTTISK